MGSYCELYISDYPVLSSKSYVAPDVMTLFREADKCVCEKSVSSRNPIAWDNDESSAHRKETTVEYRVRTTDAIDRLNVMGFTLDRAKRTLNEAVRLKIAEYREWTESDELPDVLSDTELDKIATLETSSFEDYLDAYRTLLTSGIHWVYYLERFPDAPRLIHYILDDTEEFYWGFPCSDIRYFLRAVLEIAPAESFVTQDITEVVHAGYYDEGDAVCIEALKALTNDYPRNSKIIVLTEGSTDVELLAASLKLLYPHLHEYYSFMDFGMRAPGGVGPMVDLVKSFAGAGIENRVIFLFDNDTAAYCAVDKLKGINIPSNIVVVHYPDLQLAENYPTLGPNGLANMNINGMACSIELYFGEDVLKTDGCLEPVQWKGYDEKLKRYQGEIMHKLALKYRFMEKIARCEHDSSVLDRGQWDGIISIFERMFHAFDE